jgi:hypothetical protein
VISGWTTYADGMVLCEFCGACRFCSYMNDNHQFFIWNHKQQHPKQGELNFDSQVWPLETHKPHVSGLSPRRVPEQVRGVVG